MPKLHCCCVIAASLVALSIAAPPAVARAVGVGPSIVVRVDGITLISLTCASSELLCDAEGIAWLAEDLTVTLPGVASVSLLAWNSEAGTGTYLDPDPDIFYGSSVIDFGAASDFAFVFDQGIVLTPAPGVASHDYSASTSDGGTDGVTVTALAPPIGTPVDSATDEIAVYTVNTDGGGSLLNPGLDLAPDFVGASGTSDTHGPFAEAGSGPASSGAFYNYMRVDVNFGLSGGGDAYTFNGHAQIVPEPSTAALLLLGLASIGCARRRRDH